MFISLSSKKTFGIAQFNFFKRVEQGNDQELAPVSRPEGHRELTDGVQGYQGIGITASAIYITN